MAEQPNPNLACEHGHQRRKCPYCQNIKDETRIQQLEAALKQYGRHQDDCHLRAQHDSSSFCLSAGEHGCTCGLTTTLHGPSDG